MQRFYQERIYLATNTKLIKDMHSAISGDFILLATILIRDWRILLKFYRKNSLPHLFTYENPASGLSLNSKY
jgi:hypothetical protein